MGYLFCSVLNPDSYQLPSTGKVYQPVQYFFKTTEVDYKYRLQSLLRLFQIVLLSSPITETPMLLHPQAPIPSTSEPAISDALPEPTVEESPWNKRRRETTANSDVLKTPTHKLRVWP